MKRRFPIATLEVRLQKMPASQLLRISNLQVGRRAERLGKVGFLELRGPMGAHNFLSCPFLVRPHPVRRGPAATKSATNYGLKSRGFAPSRSIFGATCCRFSSRQIEMPNARLGRSGCYPCQHFRSPAACGRPTCVTAGLANRQGRSATVDQKAGFKHTTRTARRTLR